jgi:hypothetical protein
MIVKWEGKKDKRIILKGEGVSATLHFVPGKEIKIPEGLEELLKIKMSDDLLSGKLVIVSGGIWDEKSLKRARLKKKRGKESKEEINSNPFSENENMENIE